MAECMSKVSMVPVSTWKTYSMVFDGVVVVVSAVYAAE
jgi:hypothetical protein